MNKLFLISAFVFFSLFTFSQEKEKEDESKLIREVISLQVDKYIHGPKTEKPADAPERDPGEPDTSNPYIPAPIGEVIKRAQNWYTLKSKKFTKSGGTNIGQSVSCKITIPFKQKMLNPENEVDGKINMDLKIDAKEGKYRYTISNITHVANKPGMSCGDVYAVIPECGSMKVSERTFRTIKTEAFVKAQVVVEDLKQAMQKEIVSKDDEW